MKTNIFCIALLFTLSASISCTSLIGQNTERVLLENNERSLQESSNYESDLNFLAESERAILDTGLNNEGSQAVLKELGRLKEQVYGGKPLSERQKKVIIIIIIWGVKITIEIG